MFRNYKRACWKCGQEVAHHAGAGMDRVRLWRGHRAGESLARANGVDHPLPRTAERHLVWKKKRWVVCAGSGVPDHGVQLPRRREVTVKKARMRQAIYDIQQRRMAERLG